MKQKQALNEMLKTGRLKPTQVLDVSFWKYRLKECIGGGRIKMQNASNINVAPTIKTNITTYGVVVEW